VFSKIWFEITFLPFENSCCLRMILKSLNSSTNSSKIIIVKKNNSNNSNLLILRLAKVKVNVDLYSALS